MSKTVKIHLPAGNVRVLRRESRERKQTTIPLPEHEPTQAGKPSEESEASPEMAPPQIDPFPMEDIEQQLKDEFKAGFDEGRRFAEKNMRESFESQANDLRTNTEAIITGVQEEFARYRESLERNAVTLALAIAERLVKREIQRDDELVVRQIQEAMRRIIGVDRIKIRISPADEEIVRQSRVSILGTSDSVRDLVIEADENIGRGGCILESDSGNVDALIATQIEKIEAALFTDRIEK